MTSGEQHAGLTAADLLATLTEQDGTLKNQLRAISKLATIKEVSGAVTVREERRVNYAQAKDQMDRANRVVAFNARKEFLDLSKEIDDKKAGATVNTSTSSLIQRVVPKTDLEKAILGAVGHVSDAPTAPSSDLMDPALKQKLEQTQLARLRTLMHAELSRNKRLKKIKSKTYRKITRKAEERERTKLLARLEVDQPEMAAQLKDQYERKLAVARLQRQRSARNKWAKVAQRFGGKNMRSEISRQAQEQEDEVRRLRDAVRGRTDDDSSSEEEEEESATVAEIVAQAKRKVEALVAEEEEQTSTSGLFGMAFMKRGAERKRKEAEVEANELLDELDLLESDEPKRNCETVVASDQGAFSDEQLIRATNEVAHLIPANPWINAVPTTTKDASDPPTKRRRKAETAVDEMPKTVLEESEILKNFQGDVDDDQRELIRTLFVQSEERPEIAKISDSPDAPGPQTLPGWGRWVGSGATRRSRRGGKTHKQEQTTAAAALAAARAAAGAPAPQVLKSKVSRVKTLNVPTPAAPAKVPHNFKDADEYRKFRAMETTAPELLSSSAHARVIAPRVNLRLGAVVPPLESGKQLTVGERDLMLDAWNHKRKPTRTKAKF